MDPQVVLVLTWVVAGLVVAAYIWFVVWRYRVERRKKEAEAVEAAKMSDAIARTAQRMDETAAPARTPASAPVERPPLPSRSAVAAPSLSSSAPTSASAPAPAPPSTPSAASPASGEATVASLVVGIKLPHDLVPLTTMAPRLAAGDRVAFWTDRAPAEIVGPAFADELERLGYSISSLDVQSLAAKRGDDHLMVVIHPDGPAAVVDGQVAFSSVPENSVVIEVWIPG